MSRLRLPRKILDEASRERLARELEARAETLWEGAAESATRVALEAPLASALKSAFSAGRIVRGLEGAEARLAMEQRGLERVDEATGVERGGRVSRLLVLADDGSDRFYRSIAFLLRRHAPRVLALRLDLDERALGELLFGPGQVARLLLIPHKDAVSALLLAVAAQWWGKEMAHRS